MKNQNKNSVNTIYIVITTILAAILIGLVILAFPGSDSKDSPKTKTSGTSYSSGTNSNTNSDKTQSGAKSSFDSTVVFKTLEDLEGLEFKTVTFTMTDGQKFTMNVYPEIAPKTVENFLKLVDSGFYDGLIFHRVIEGFMAQGGDPEGTGMGGAPEKIIGEFASNGFYNPLSHQRGVVSMARSNSPDSASSQFFICYDDASFLDGDYASFGFVTEGMEVVDSFLSEGTDASDRPLKDVRIYSAKIAE